MSDPTQLHGSLPSPQAAVYIPALCPTHQCLTVSALGIGPDGPWQMTLLAVQLACFRAVTFDARFTKRTEGDPAVMTAVLEEIGCLACWNSRAFHVAIHIAKHDRDYMPLFGVAYGKTRHPLWPDEWTIVTEGAGG